jgi:Ca2+-binding EF-hand superfamily protein
MMISSIGDSGNYMNYLQQAQTIRTKQGPPDIFKELDSDNSGGISQSELDSWAKKLFNETGQTIDTSEAISACDSDSDGVLSSSELNAYLKANAPPPPSFHGICRGAQDLFSALDIDESGGVSQSELDSWAKNISSETGKTIDSSSAISTYDSDSDGVLSSEELKSFLEANGIEAPNQGFMPPGPPPPETGSAVKSADSIISGYDTNGDGVLSSAELQTYLDDTEQTSSSNDSNILAQAISSYLMNMGKSTSTGFSAYIENLNLNIDFSG